MVFALQALWEDTRSGTKWAIVNCCYYPSGLPENIQKPETPENDEVILLQPYFHTGVGFFFIFVSIYLSNDSRRF